MKYKCESCGREHDEWPSLTFNTPHNYHTLSEEDKTRIAKVDTDFCTIAYAEQTDRFIRCTLTQTVNDHCQDLDYGIWVSLSEKSFNDYKENYDNPNREASYFGWFCSMIPQYESTRSIPTTVFTRKGNLRPCVVPHKDFDHPFVRDYYNGISKAEAEARIADMIDKMKDRVEHEPPKSFFANVKDSLRKFF